jgi:hypothetical protein
MLAHVVDDSRAMRSIPTRLPTGLGLDEEKGAAAIRAAGSEMIVHDDATSVGCGVGS